MGLWLINADTLARGRFVISPLAEAVACLKLLERGTPSTPADRVWLDDHLPDYRARLAADPITALLIKSALGRRWNADFLTPTPAGEGERPFHEELADVRAWPPDAVRDHLVRSLERPLPGVLSRPRARSRRPVALPSLTRWDGCSARPAPACCCFSTRPRARRNWWR